MLNSTLFLFICTAQTRLTRFYVFNNITNTISIRSLYPDRLLCQLLKKLQELYWFAVFYTNQYFWSC